MVPVANQIMSVMPIVKLKVIMYAVSQSSELMEMLNSRIFLQMGKICK